MVEVYIGINRVLENVIHMLPREIYRKTKLLLEKQKNNLNK